MEYNKLVRDKIPSRLARKGISAKFHTASKKEYTAKLTKKLVEEANEFSKSGDVEELADMVEVIYAILVLSKVSKPQLEAIRKKKAKERGAFRKRLILERTSS